MFAVEPKLIQEWTRPGRFLTGKDMVEAGIAKMVDLSSGTLWQQIEKHSK